MHSMDIGLSNLCERDQRWTKDMDMNLEPVLKKFDGDKERDRHYAKDYASTVARNNSDLFVLLQALVGCLLIFGLTFALLTGYFGEALLALIAATTLWWAVKFVAWRKDIQRRREAHEAAYERKLGIDRRWGRVGAKKVDGDQR